MKLNLKNWSSWSSRFSASFILFTVIVTLITFFILDSIVGPAIIDNYVGQNSYIINRMGQIRGSIQRYSKLKIFGINSSEVETFIDNSFNELEKKYLSDSFVLEAIEKKEIIDGFKKMKACWEALKKVSNKNREDILKVSEKCWRYADKETTTFQKISDEKLEKIKTTFKISRYIVISLLVILFIFVYRYIRKGLEKDNITDSLTDAYNRSYFEYRLKNEIGISNRYGSKFSLILLDIDYFKSINDKFGHQAGDEVLKQFSKVVHMHLRRSDMFFRVGGEEFAILLPLTQLNEAIQIAERLRESIASHKFDIDRDVTASFGVSEYKDGEEAFDLMDRTDKALYAAKKGGRNRVESS